MPDTEKIKELRQRCNHYTTEISRLEFHIFQLKTENDQLKKMILQKEGLKNQTKEFYGALDQFIMKRIDNRGYKTRFKKMSQNPQIAVEQLENASTDQLLAAAKSYDVKQFFTYHSPKKRMKLQYRIASKAYRTTRNVSIKIAKSGYRVMRGRNNNVEA